MRRGALLLSIALGAAYGAGTQFLGARTTWGWAWQELSAPWLMVPFLAGWAQSRRRPAVIAGLLATYAALAGYFFMTLGPVEGATLDANGVVHLVKSQALWEVGGLLSGPAFGWLGWRWRTSRYLLGPVSVVGAFLLEPLDGQAHLPPVTAGEVAAGIALAVSLLIVRAARAPSLQPSARQE